MAKVTKRERCTECGQVQVVGYKFFRPGGAWVCDTCYRTTS